MIAAPELFADICVAGAGIGCLYLLLAAILVLRFPRQSEAPDVPAEAANVPLTVLKPLRGAEPDLQLRVAALCRQDYAADVQIICGVGECGDAATVQIAEIIHGNSGKVDLVIDSKEHGLNRKISNLTNMFAAARHDVLIMADSDIEVDTDYLSNVIAQLHKPNVGVVSCLYHGVPSQSIWSRHAALAINSHFLPSVVLALSFGLARPCFGSTIAIHRNTLSRLGGFKAFANQLADDYAMGAAVRAAGYEIAIPAFSVGHRCFCDSLFGLLAQELRTARTIKNIDLPGYVGSAITHPFPLALIGAAFGVAGAPALAAAALACRAAVCRSVEHAFGIPRQPYWLLPIRDVLSFVVFAASFFGRTIKWRGFSYRVRPDGMLARAEQAASSSTGAE